MVIWRTRWGSSMVRIDHELNIQPDWSLRGEMFLLVWQLKKQQPKKRELKFLHCLFLLVLHSKLHRVKYYLLYFQECVGWCWVNLNPSDLSPWAGFWENPLSCRWWESASYFPRYHTSEKPPVLKHTSPFQASVRAAVPVLLPHWAPELLLPRSCSCSHQVALPQRRSVVYRQGSCFSELHTTQSPARCRSRATCSDLLVLRQCFRIIHV